MQAEGTVADRFAIDHVVASGGMGTVYRARDQRSGAVVALKLLLESDASSVERFEREARSISELVHPGVVRSSRVSGTSLPSDSRKATSRSGPRAAK